MRTRIGAVVLLCSALAQASVIVSGAQGLTVHEWGTFTSVAGPGGGAVQWTPLSGPSDLPCFVTMLNPTSVKVVIIDPVAASTPPAGLPGLKATVRMETPVLYFYSPINLTARVRVAFPQGVMSEWYPRASVPFFSAAMNLANYTGTIEWNAVNVLPNTSPALATERSPSHYYAARETDAAPVQVGSQSEKFLFYRGLASFPVPVSARLTDSGGVIVQGTRPEGLPNAVLFENNGRTMGYRVLGHVGGPVTVERPALTSNIEALRADLEKMLVKQGLFPREAKAMVETWRDSWFEEGTRLFYVLPQEAVNAILPLQIDPAPAHVARVFVGRVELITPAMEAEVDRAMRANDVRVLLKYGRFLEPVANRLIERSTAEDQSRIRAILRTIGAAQATAAAESACR